MTMMKSVLSAALCLLILQTVKCAHYQDFGIPKKVPLTDTTHWNEDGLTPLGSKTNQNVDPKRIDPIQPPHHEHDAVDPLANHETVEQYLNEVENGTDKVPEHDEHGPLAIDDEEARENHEMDTDRELKVDEFMKGLKDMECEKDNGQHGEMDANGNYDEIEVHDEYQTLCGSVLRRLALHPLGNYDFNHHDFFKYLNEKIYLPLAYKMNKRDSMAGLLQDLIFLDKDNSLFNGRPLMTNYPVFERSIMAMFEDIAAKTNDLDANQQYISESIISILKRFHLYWNSLRYTNQISKVKVDTKEILQSLLQSYEIKRKFLAEVTRTLVTKIRDAYFRFLRAHRMLEIMNTSGANIMVFQLLRRYKDVVDNIRLNRVSNPKLVHEISLMMELVKAFHIINYKLKKSEPDSITMFNTQILIRLENVYKILQTQLGSDIRWKDIKDFSATLILKLMHRTFVIFKVNSISQVVNKPLMSYESGFELNTKVFYQLLDNMMLIPRTCANFLVLKSCAHHEAVKVLRYLAGRYKLKRSTSGWVIFDDISAAVKQVFSKANNLVWNNFTTFKMYYYQNLFAVLYNLKLRFFIKNMDEVEDLENAIGDLIERTKSESAAGKGRLNLNLIERLDQDIYNKFLNIKAKYNRFSPVRKDLQVLAMIKRDIKKFLASFLENHATDVTPKFQQLVSHINANVKEWVIECTNKPETSVQVANLPLGMPMTVPIVHHIMDSSMPDTHQMGTDIPHDENNIQHDIADASEHHELEDQENQSLQGDDNVDTNMQNGHEYINSEQAILDEAQNELQNNLTLKASDNSVDIEDQDHVGTQSNKGIISNPDEDMTESDPANEFGGDRR